MKTEWVPLATTPIERKVAPLLGLLLRSELFGLYFSNSLTIWPLAIFESAILTSFVADNQPFYRYAQDVESDSLWTISNHDSSNESLKLGAQCGLMLVCKS